jgi:hypothetical protein
MTTLSKNVLTLVTTLRFLGIGTGNAITTVQLTNMEKPIWIQSTRSTGWRVSLQLVDEKIVVPSKSLWAFPIVVVWHKCTGKMMICMDIRGLNRIKLRDSYPIPQFEDVTDPMLGAQFLTGWIHSRGFTKSKQLRRLFQNSLWIHPLLHSHTRSCPLCYEYVDFRLHLC